MSDGAALLRQSLWSALGWSLPALASLWAVPGLVRTLGPTGFGLLAIAWALVGWFSAADLGLSRAVTQGVARALARDARAEAAALTWSALALMLPVSVVAAAALWWSAPWLVGVLKLEPHELADGIGAVQWIALAVPATVLMTALRGVLEGARAFKLVTLLRVPLGVAFALVPLAFAMSGHGVVGAVKGIVLVRAIGLVAHAAAALRLIPGLRTPTLASPEARRAQLAFGGWTTVTNVVSPLMNAVDRLGIGALITVAAMAPYAVAVEAGTKIWLLTGILVPVLYPTFAALMTRDADTAAARLEQGNRAILAAGLPVLVGFASLAEPGMRWWVGISLASDAALALQWLAVGLAANLSAQMILAFVQAAERPSLVAWGHLIELPLFVLGLLWAVPRHGSVGAAAVWTIRAVGDMLWLLVAAEHAAPSTRRRRCSLLVWPLLASGIVGSVALVAHVVPPPLAFGIGLVIWAGLVTRGGLLTRGEWRGIGREFDRISADAGRR